MTANLFGQEPWQRRGEQPVSSIGMSELPVGVPVPWPAATPPAGWLICNGGAVPAGCPTLTSLYGANLPDLKGRVIVGLDAAQVEFDTIGETGGSKATTALHTHGASSGGIDQIALTSAVAQVAAGAGFVAINAWTGSTDTGDPAICKSNGNLQPYKVFNYIVRAA